MPHKISILVRADVGRDAIELFVSGCLTGDSISALAAQIVKARVIDPSAPILVDLTAARHIEPDALEQLRSQAEAENVGGHPDPSLRLVTPETTPSCPLPGTARDDSF